MLEPNFCILFGIEANDIPVSMWVSSSLYKFSNPPSSFSADKLLPSLISSSPNKLLNIFYDSFIGSINDFLNPSKVSSSGAWTNFCFSLSSSLIYLMYWPLRT
jgi:hypothetical protein